MSGNPLFRLNRKTRSFKTKVLTAFFYLSVASLSVCFRIREWIFSWWLPCASRPAGCDAHARRAAPSVESISQCHFKNNAPQTRCFFFAMGGGDHGASRERCETSWSRNIWFDSAKRCAWAQRRQSISQCHLKKTTHLARGAFFILRCGGDHGASCELSWFFSLIRGNKKAPAAYFGGRSWICCISPSPHAAAINNKQKDNKLNKKQNKGSKRRTGRNNGGVVDNDVIEKLLIHDQKKSRNIGCSGIGSL